LIEAIAEALHPSWNHVDAEIMLIVRPSPYPTIPCAGQFGTRLQGGKDAASPRYIFTRLAPLTRHLFNEHDDCLLSYLNEEGQTIEPDW
jgi:DNA gyrase/topoisomerase IV subunit A